ncbi:MAG: polyketide synthase, partial [Thermoanaerobaculia bacterium]
MERSPERGEATGLEIAVIAMAARFPGAGSIEELWANLEGGVESISFFSEEELRADGIDPELLHHPKLVKAGAVLDGVELFDAELFELSAREAALTDPQQRLFLECCWEALERAGIDSQRHRGPIGVYAGASRNTYLLAPGVDLEMVRRLGGAEVDLANNREFLTTRVAYKLDLKGPAITVQTACSTSLVAIHLGCEGLLNGGCDLALAGGVSVRLPQRSGYLYQEGGIASPDGHCRPFDAGAQGTLGGNGAGVVALKRLEDALRDGD